MENIKTPEAPTIKALWHTKKKELTEKTGEKITANILNEFEKTFKRWDESLDVLREAAGRESDIFLEQLLMRGGLIWTVAGGVMSLIANEPYLLLISIAGTPVSLVGLVLQDRGREKLIAGEYDTEEIKASKIALVWLDEKVNALLSPAPPKSEI